jgi:hypothetical protein
VLLVGFVTSLEVWYPKMVGFTGSVPYGVVGSVSALAMGARAIDAPIAPAANHGATYLITVFNGVLLLAGASCSYYIQSWPPNGPVSSPLAPTGPCGQLEFCPLVGVMRERMESSSCRTRSARSTKYVDIEDVLK